MTSFSNDESAWSSLDFRLLRDGGVVLYYSNEVLDGDLAWLRNKKYQVVEFDARLWMSEGDFHSNVAQTLKFPDYYGRNLDAFNDCMGDFEVPEEGGVALVIRNVETVDLRNGQFMSIILDILAGTIRTNLLFGRRLLTLLQSGNPGIVFSPVGAVPVLWNPQEWLNSKRGL